MLDFAAGNRNAARPAPVTGVDDILDDPDDRRHVIVRRTVGGGYGSVTGAISVAAAAAPHSAGAVPNLDLDQDMTGD